MVLYLAALLVGSALLFYGAQFAKSKALAVFVRVVAFLLLALVAAQLMGYSLFSLTGN